MGEARRLWEQAWEAIEAGKGAGLAELFHPDIDLRTSSAEGQGVGYAQGVFARHKEAYPDLIHEVEDIVESADGRSMVAELVFHGTHSGTLRHPDGREIPPTGLRLTWRAVDKVRVADGRITSWHAMFDRLSLLVQLQSAGV
jgi:predicted ester cyclase